MMTGHILNACGPKVLLDRLVHVDLVDRTRDLRISGASLAAFGAGVFLISHNGSPHSGG